MAMRMAVAAAMAVVAVLCVLAPPAAAQTSRTPDCAAKLAPCAPYINTTGPPPDTCCGPIKDAVDNDLRCLCGLYAAPEIFKAFNINVTQALGVSKRCGLSDTTEACKSNSPFIFRRRISVILLTFRRSDYPASNLQRSVRTIIKESIFSNQFVMFSDRFALVGMR
ncbi:lipid transfer-like protein VAS [Panicum miliaceum]|uniref:Lipid transfer-like protein VAS n=1 Tax=Panicum miliaceum TaxID=4540 RepID=A0A3L6S0R0_PANMI|nr:lipid transfer-like protein VAS [Panicum miliaceum]